MPPPRSGRRQAPRTTAPVPEGTTQALHCDSPAYVAAELFEGLPHVMFAVKDLTGTYVLVNQAFADRVRRPSPADVVGHRASDFFPQLLAASYEAQDVLVQTTGRSLRSELEVVLRTDGSPGWFVTNKVPQLDVDQRVIGTASVSVDLQQPAGSGSVLTGLVTVVNEVRERYAEPLRVDALAATGGMTPLQLERRMRRYLGVSPKQHIMRTRLEQATRMLAEGDISIADVASRCGYYDQSAMTRHFKRVTGLTPGDWAVRVGRRLG